MARRAATAILLPAALALACGGSPTEPKPAWQTLLLVAHGEGTATGRANLILGLEAADGRRVRQWEVGYDPGQLVASPDGRRVAVAPAAAPLREFLLLELEGPGGRTVRLPAGYAARDMAWADERTLVLAVTNPDGLLVLDVTGGDTVRFVAAPEAAGHVPPHLPATVSRVVAVPGSSRVWGIQPLRNQQFEADARSGRVTQVVGDELTAFPSALAFSPDGGVLWGSSGQGGVTVRDPRTGAIREVLRHLGSPAELRFSRDGRRVFLRYGHGQLAVADAATGELLRAVQLAGDLRSFAESPDGASVYAALQTTGEYPHPTTFIQTGPGVMVVLDAATLQERGRIVTAELPLGVAVVARP